MKKILFRSLALVLAMTLMVTSVVVAATTNAEYFTHSGDIYIQGTYTVGTPVTIAEQIAAPDDGKFVQLGPNSYVILKFPGNTAAKPDGTSAADLRIDIYDAAFEADATIYGSLNGTTWITLGTYADTANIDLDLIGPLKYVKVDQGSNYIDPAYPLLGFDLDAVVALNSGILPYGVITQPAFGVTVSGNVLFEALYWDDDPGIVQWAVRKGTCAANTGTVFGNVDGFNDSYSWDGHLFQTTADTSSWDDGPYCFVFNPTEESGEQDIRLTQFNVVSNNQPPTVDAGGPYSDNLGSDIPILGSALDPDGDPLSTTWTVNNTACHIADPNALDTSVSCTNVGTYTLTLKASDGTAEATDTATVTVSDPYMTQGINDCTHGSYDRYNYVETLFVSSVGSGATTPVVTSTLLDPAHKYLIEASGVYYAGGQFTYDIRADAKYSQDAIQRGTDPFGIWTDLVNGYEGYGAGLLELKVDGAYVEWGDYNPAHVYTLEKSGTGSALTLQFQIYDIYAQNNTGGLCVSLFEFENESPVADPNGPYLGAVGSPIAFDGSGSSDPNDDPLTYSWHFGDGSPVTDGANPSHTYDTPFIYDVCLTVNDGYVNSEQVCTTAVVYDPSGGFVTGGGWIDSPADQTNVAFNTIPDQMSGNYPSQPYQAQQTAEFGDHIQFSGTDRLLDSVMVTMSSWACETGNWYTNDCTTSEGSGFDHPLTFNIYEVEDDGGTPVIGTLLTTVTQNTFIPFRPSANPSCSNGGWGEDCFNGYAFNVTFDMSSLNTTLPDEIIYGLAFNTQTWGYNPIGMDGPYNSLNFALVEPGIDQWDQIGIDVNPDAVFWNTETAGYYSDGGAAGVGIFRQDTGWSGYVPAVRIFVTSQGAYKPNPTLGGKATFGFVSKYKKGADVPEGNTEFQFKAGNLNFHSSDYDWLIVTGSNYAKFKGTGTINGEGTYKFQIWAGDNDPDTFRIKIWDAVTEAVIYDNGMDQEIGGGSIVVHTTKK